MFGEHNEPSESPRVPSPWDPFLPTPPSVSSSLGKYADIPKLTPEVEEGNVEYKLKLTNISPARFDRLVTQLKWRLLEGGGQAYYELGVADSGALIGLTPSDLEQSLETLELMAGEIGASVIIVKEIEVPPLMVALADKLSGYLNLETGKWADKMTNRRAKPGITGEEAEDILDTPGSPPEPFTDFSTADSTDFEDEILTACTTPAESSRASPHPVVGPTFLSRPKSSNPFRPTAQSSPFIGPIDDELALFSMEPEPNFDEHDLQLDTAPAIDGDTEGISVDLEITPVYKPRPIRKRDPTLRGFPSPGQGKRGHKVKRHQPWHSTPRAELLTLPSAESAHATPAQTKETKAQLHRQSRDRRRQEKRQALAASLAGSAALPAIIADSNTVQLVQQLEQMHVTAESDVADPLRVAEVDAVTSLALAADKLVEFGSVDALLATEIPVTTRMESRLIVEAFVVRKLSLEEAYLDFSGF
ncbi:hypothetical protein EUX98_g8178 [Antrodiella citrinella]|uniref:Uncharacterized protein n=1 Tax=Antrodiella citrinella TaxID=2447956 RepID=A0A4S4MBA7_9APHY|nr:hypothetical protein EUX98_g8178 [Antrodiella citrinella]